MITITRRRVRGLRRIFRRSVLGIAHRGPIPPLVFRAEGSQLRVQHRHGFLGVEYAQENADRIAGTVVLPFDALAEFEGRDESSVVLEAITPDHTVVRYEDRHVLRSREFTTVETEALEGFPLPPRSWANVSADLLNALAEASRTACAESTRYALSCLQLRGDTGEIAATDGRQLLIRRGFPLPFTDHLLIPRSPLFAHRDLPRDQPIGIGRTETHLALRVGPWTLFLEIQTSGRFPDFDHVVPNPGSAATRLRLDDADAAFLVKALDRLPGTDERNAPATLDLNCRIAVRTRGPDQERATELVLTRSCYTGTPVRLNVNRDFLGRALRLGLREIEIVDPDTPVACRDDRHTYAFQPLSRESAIGPSDDVIRLESSSTVTRSVTRPPEEPPKARTVVSEPTNAPRNTPKSDHPTKGDAPTEPTGTTGLAALIQEAEALHGILSDGKTRAGRLVSALRRHRKQSRLVQETLRSLRQLKLQDVAG